MAEYLSRPTSFPISTSTSLLFDKIQMQRNLTIINEYYNYLGSSVESILIFLNHLQRYFRYSILSEIWNWFGISTSYVDLSLKISLTVLLLFSN